MRSHSQARGSPVVHHFVSLLLTSVDSSLARLIYTSAMEQLSSATGVQSANADKWCFACGDKPHKPYDYAPLFRVSGHPVICWSSKSDATGIRTHGDWVILDRRGSSIMLSTERTAENGEPIVVMSLCLLRMQRWRSQSPPSSSLGLRAYIVHSRSSVI